MRQTKSRSAVCWKFNTDRKHREKSIRVFGSFFVMWSLLVFQQKHSGFPACWRFFVRRRTRSLAAERASPKAGPLTKREQSKLLPQARKNNQKRFGLSADSRWRFGGRRSEGSFSDGQHQQQQQQQQPRWCVPSSTPSKPPTVRTVALLLSVASTSKETPRNLFFSGSLSEKDGFWGFCLGTVDNTKARRAEGDRR
jgi:hypothetical protein